MKSGSAIACLASGAAMLSLVLAFGGPSARSQDETTPPPSTFDQAFREAIRIKIKPEIEIAPQVKKGSAQEGSWTGVTNDIFGAMLGRSGITPGVTDALGLKGRPGFLEQIKTSGVVNDGGHRATFGYFVRVHEPAFNMALEYFVLFSYDDVRLGADGKYDPSAPTTNAFEMFIFGPLPRAGTGGEMITKEGSTPILAGLAVDGSGHLLSAVPLSVAHAHKWDKSAGEEDQVHPGLGRSGCFECHSRNTDDGPQSSTPFPWQETNYNFATNQAGPEPESEPSPPSAPVAPPSTPPEHSSATGSQHVLHGIGVEPPTLAKAGKDDSDTPAQPAPKAGQPPSNSNPTMPH